MKTVGAFEAKTHLSELLRRVSNGETIQITRRGIPIAKLVPAESKHKDKDRQSRTRVARYSEKPNLGRRDDSRADR